MEQRRGLLGLLAVFAVLLVVMGGAYAGARMPAWGSSELDETRATLSDVERQLAEASTQVAVLQNERSAQQTTIVGLTERIGEREREVGTLQSSLALTGPIGEQYAALTAQLADLQTRFNALQATHSQLDAEYSRLTRIRTPELPGDALLLDRSVEGVTYTGAVCSGSMEPNISCDDLLILYPPSITDLGVGDIIYFPRRSADCSSALEGRFLLHRIIDVTAGEAGVQYRTKGDALANPDGCPVPANEVMYKLLTNIRDARIDG